MTSGSSPRRAADRVRTIYLGSGSYASPIFEAMAAHPPGELVCVVTAPDRPA
jgi:methionyl-tRNA formyltransferase